MVFQILMASKREPQLRKFWLVMAVCAPFFGGLIYQIVHERVRVEEEEQQQAAPGEIAA